MALGLNPLRSLLLLYLDVGLAHFGLLRLSGIALGLLGLFRLLAASSILRLPNRDLSGSLFPRALFRLLLGDYAVSRLNLLRGSGRRRLGLDI